ncbi:DUF1294 domain-containing protein [Fervidicella metallireducens]|uniref:DUF1294 domain-containing protein n=1 Tax=Fervidicella metallireducens TaxID=655338 RepID=UPI00241883B9|nr:DUF1294 domain-containing protein [Fervidicella metallireducens]
MSYLWGYLIIVNFYAFYMMYIDKLRAKKGIWRISERKFFALTLLFGSLGVLLGMKFFRHKTRHIKFRFLVPMILIIQIILIILLYKHRIEF